VAQGVLSLQPGRQEHEVARLLDRAAAVAGVEHGHRRRPREFGCAVGEDDVRLPGPTPHRASALRARSSGKIRAAESCRFGRRLRDLRPTILAGLVVLGAMGTARADDPSVAGVYDVKFEEMASNCTPPLVSMGRGKVRIDIKKNVMTVNIELI